MKKLLTGWAVTTVSIIGMSGMASAQAQISNTGPGSTNTITTNDSTVCNSTSTNTAVVTNTNIQTSASGASSVNGNTTGGSASSGGSNNTNNTLTNIIATNASGCLPATTAAVTPGGGKGADTPVAETVATGGQGAASVAALPDTGQATPKVYAASTALISGLALAGVAGRDAMLRRREQ